MALLETRGLSKAFGGLRAVNELDLRVEPGEIVGMIGPNGSGKTTVFNLITGIYRSTAGRMTFLGRDGSPTDLAGLSSHTITALGVARTFQNQRLFNQMTVLENVLVGMHCRTRAGIIGILLGLRGARREKARVIDEARELLGRFGDRLLLRADELAASLSYAN